MPASCWDRWTWSTRAERRHASSPVGLLTLSSAVLVLVLALAASSCGYRGLALVQDRRLDITSPKQRAEVTLPVRLAWTMEDFAVGPGQGSFGIVLDRQAPPPGQTLEWLFRGDETCAATPGCPDTAYLADRYVFRTTEPSLTIERLPDIADGEFHEATIVLLDAEGRRIGESGWTVQFEQAEES